MQNLALRIRILVSKQFSLIFQSNLKTMKKIFFLILIISLITLVSCQKEEKHLCTTCVAKWWDSTEHTIAPFCGTEQECLDYIDSMYAITSYPKYQDCSNPE